MSPRGALARLALLLLAVALPRDPARAADEPVIPPPAGYVTDAAGALDEPFRAKLEAFLDQVERRTGAQFALLIVPRTAPLTPTEYKVRVFERWKIGRRGEDDGLLLLVAIEEREARFETGYGLEGTLPDGFQSRVFRREMAPRFRDGDLAGGITAGLLACAARVAAEKGVTLEWNGEELRYRRYRGTERPPWWVLLIVGIVIVVVLSQLSRPGRRRRRRGWWMTGPGSFGGGWTAGGGFGGSFGGGGSSFGGFGGGSSGGGGGGGRW